MELTHTHRVQEDEANERLDIIMTRLVAGVSRAMVQKAIKEGRVLVNGKKETPHKRLMAQDEITWENIFEKEKIALTPNAKITFPILEKTEDFFVINKPSGLIVHQSEAHPESDTLANALVAQFPELANVGEDPLRPGMVHRLDKEASGLMIIARTQEMFAYLKKLFAERKITKEYTAVVHGKLSQASGTINLPIMRSTSKHGRMAARTDGEGKEAITHYEVLREERGKSWLRVKIETGRTHQIRTHLAALGYPIVGDKIYGGKITQKDTGRLLLHATKLTFTDRDGKEQYFESAPEFGDFSGKERNSAKT